MEVSPWLYLSAAVVLSYLTYLDPLNHREIEWVRQVEWYPTLILLALAGSTHFLHPRSVGKDHPAPQRREERPRSAQGADAD